MSPLSISDASSQSSIPAHSFWKPSSKKLATSVSYLAQISTAIVVPPALAICKLWSLCTTIELGSQLKTVCTAKCSRRHHLRHSNPVEKACLNTLRAYAFITSLYLAGMIYIKLGSWGEEGFKGILTNRNATKETADNAITGLLVMEILPAIPRGWLEGICGGTTPWFGPNFYKFVGPGTATDLNCHLAYMFICIARNLSLLNNTVKQSQQETMTHKPHTRQSILLISAAYLVMAGMNVALSFLMQTTGTLNPQDAKDNPGQRGVILTHGLLSFHHILKFLLIQGTLYRFGPHAAIKLISPGGEFVFACIRRFTVCTKKIMTALPHPLQASAKPSHYTTTDPHL